MQRASSYSKSKNVLSAGISVGKTEHVQQKQSLHSIVEDSSKLSLGKKW